MSAEYRNNHYVPQWYQRQFIPPGQADRELYLLDLKPEKFRDGRGVRHRRKALKRTGTKHCFAIDDLYTTRLGGYESRELERVFFGEVDSRGKRAVEFFAGFDHKGMDKDALDDLMLYMSTQKLRTPKGLDWLVQESRASHREDALDYLVRLQSVYGAVWAECVWQLADASESPTKFLVSDHPVTVYNKACSPKNPQWCKGSNDPDIRLHGTHTLFPLSSERLLILTNRSWACNPYRSAITFRDNPQLHRDALFNFLDIQVRRKLSEQEVCEVNFILKARAYRYVAAGREEWLYPERSVKVPWRSLGSGHLLMPEPRSLIPGSEMTLGYADGSTTTLDSLGRRPDQPDFGRESRSATEWETHKKWRAEFETLFGSAHRGLDWENLRIKSNA